MVKKSWIIGGFVIAGVVLGVLAIGGNSLINQYAQKEVEQGLSDGTGLEVDCAEANVNLFSQSIKMMDIRFSNLAGFPSPYIFKIGSIEFQAERLNAKPLNFEMMIIKDVEINIDIKFSNNPAQPQNMIHMNVQEMQEKANNGGSKKNRVPQQPKPIIQQMLFKNIQVNINAQLPLQSNPVKEQFQIQEISLRDLTNENLPKKLLTTVQEQILVEGKKRLSHKNAPQLNQILEPLMGLSPQNSSPLSLPKRPSLPLPSQQPKPPSPPKLPDRPSLP